MGDFFLRGETCPVSQHRCLRWHKRDLSLPALSPPKGLERLLLTCKVCAKTLPSINGLGGGCGCATCPVNKRSVSVFKLAQAACCCKECPVPEGLAHTPHTGNELKSLLLQNCNSDQELGLRVLLLIWGPSPRKAAGASLFPAPLSSRSPPSLYLCFPILPTQRWHFPAPNRSSPRVCCASRRLFWRGFSAPGPASLHRWSRPLCRQAARPQTLPLTSWQRRPEKRAFPLARAASAPEPCMQISLAPVALHTEHGGFELFVLGSCGSPRCAQHPWLSREHEPSGGK